MIETPSERRQAAEEGPLGRLSGAMVKLYKEQFGRGPTRTRSHWAGPDTVVCELWDSFTPVERTMVQMGEHSRLREMRLFFQYASEAQFKAAAEEVFGRRVRAFVSGVDAQADLSVELFVFEPEDARAAR
ncbi:MAG: DUF2294 domain-containing protein [Phycisphaerales bacterium]|nr:DUF2294 domain-containing protein [Phycisphaerales bacterium]